LSNSLHREQLLPNPIGIRQDIAVILFLSSIK